MILKPQPTSTTKFTYIPDGRTFVTEASDLGNSGAVAGLFGRVYDDACDYGLTLVSHKTGREVVCSVVETMEREGETLGWVLKPVKPAEANLFTVHVYND